MVSEATMNNHAIKKIMPYVSDCIGEFICICRPTSWVGSAPVHRNVCPRQIWENPWDVLRATEELRRHSCAICWTNSQTCHDAGRYGLSHYNNVIMSAMASQITDVSIVCSAVGSGTDQRKHQSSASLAFVRGIHRWPGNSPHIRPVTRKMFPFDDVIIRNCRPGTHFTNGFPIVI